jgi:hypothetical protein
MGDTTTITTSVYNTENLQIVSDAIDGPALLISQSGDGVNNLFTAEYNNNELMVIKSSGNVGIGVSDPSTKLQVDGTVTATMFNGEGAQLFNVNFGDRTTSLLVEGSNLYYTDQRVGVIILSSNIETSNYIMNTSNEIGNTLLSTSNVISERISLLDLRMSNYLNITSNELGNTLQFTSNIISERISVINVETSNYILNNSNIISTRITDLNTDIISEGIHNKYIIDNVYDNNMTITGKLTVSMLEVTDLDVVYESNGESTNSDLITYIQNTTSNVIDSRLLDLTNTIASLTARIVALENA